MGMNSPAAPQNFRLLLLNTIHWLAGRRIDNWVFADMSGWILRVDRLGQALSAVLGGFTCQENLA